MSITRDLLVGLATELSAAGVLTYANDSTTQIFLKQLPTSPDRCLAITSYATSDEAKITLSSMRIQFWFRGTPNDSVDVDDLADAAFNVLQGMENRTYGSVHLVQCNRVSSSPLGLDENKRAERSDNYEVDVDVPVTAGRPW
jgi:hypothetical protein